jgi:iron complex outermembrane receptor protein
MTILPARRASGAPTLKALLLTAAALSPGAVWAQPLAEAGSAPADAPSVNVAAAEVDALVVTARYRNEDVQTVPIPVTTLGVQQLEALGGTFNLKQLMQQLPSLNIQGFSGRNQTTTVRGIGTNAGGTNDGLEQGVGLYIDGVYRPRTGTAITDLVDVESIQLLRGPQGTLFGKNTVAGAIDIRTQEPSLKPEWKTELSTGNYKYLRGYLSYTGPITDTLALRVSYLRTEREGLAYNTVYKKRWDNLDNNAYRLDLLYKPSDAFKLRVTADYSIQKGNMGFNVVTAVLPTTKANGSVVRGFYEKAASVGYTPITIDPFARKVDLDNSQFDRMPSWGVQSRADWQVGGFTLSSISAYRDWRWIPNYDGDQIGANVSTQGIVDTVQTQFSQELRLVSPDERRVQYTAGLYYFWQEADDWTTSAYGRDAAKWLLGPTYPDAVLNGVASVAHVVPATKSYAAYGQATWNVRPDLRLTAGLRYTYEKKTGLYDAKAAGVVTPIADLPVAWQALATTARANYAPVGRYEAAWDGDNISGLLSASYDLADDVHVYASYSRGYKSAGINLVRQTLGVDIFVDPEKVDDYELGLKTQLLDRRLELNGNLFWATDQNYQANYVNTTVSPAATYIANTGTLRSRGVEIDARAAPFAGLTATLSATYNEARYQSYKNASAQYLSSYLGVKDLSGSEASGAPRWSVAATLRYAHPVTLPGGGGGEAYIGGDYSLRSHFFAAVNDDIFSLVPSYQLVGLNGGLRSDKGWDASLWVRNLFDKDYFNTLSVNATYGIVQGTLGEPRTFGVTLRAKY